MLVKAKINVAKFQHVNFELEDCLLLFQEHGTNLGGSLSLASSAARQRIDPSGVSTKSKSGDQLCHFLLVKVIGYQAYKDT